MTRKKVLWAAGGILAFWCILGGIAFGVRERIVPPVSEQLPENYSHLYIQILYPQPQVKWPLNSFIPIQVKAQAAERITQVDVFINDVPLAQQAVDTDSFSGSWMWQAGTAGEFVLVARAITESGAVSLSEPVHITAIDAAFTVSPINAQGGETLESIAQAEGIPIGELQQSNPNINPTLPLQPGEVIFIPNHPVPVTNPQIIPVLPINPLADKEAVTPVPDNNSPSGEPSGPQTDFFDDLKFLIEINNQGNGQNKDAPKLPPKAPGLTGDFKNCDIHLTMIGSYSDPIDPLAVKMQEDGFFVYRSRDGGSFERIHTIPPIHDDKDAANYKFDDPDQYGTLTYYISAFNVLGESASNPVTIALDSGLCPAPARGGLNEIHMENGDLILPFQMDTAYLYLQINDSKAVRVPEGERTFLPGSGIRFNVYKYLDTMIDTLQEPDLELHMEVWGWQGGMLKYVGEFDTSVHRSLIMICSIEGEGSCTNGNGVWVGSLTLPEDQPLNELKYEVKWQVTGLTTAETIYFQVAAGPYTGDDPAATSNLLYARRMSVKGSGDVFVLWLGQILYPDPPNTHLGWGSEGVYPPSPFDFTTNGFLGQPPGKSFTLYLRMVPGLVMTGYKHISNIVPVMYKTSFPPDDLPPLASENPSIYDVEILKDTYKEPDFFIDGMWGCVVIDEDPTKQFAVDQIVCPGKMPPQNDCPGDIWEQAECLLGGMLDSIGFAYDHIAFALEFWPREIGNGIIDIIPGCEGSGDCEKAVHTSVDTVWEAVTDLPADMPQSNELIADSLAEAIINSAVGMEKYYTEQDESLIEAFCDTAVDCKEELSKYIEVRLKQMQSLSAQKACTNAYEAYIRGQLPNCLSLEMTVHAAPGASNSPAVVFVRITRKTTPESLAVQQTNHDKYQIFVKVDAETFNAANQTTLKGPLYETAQIPIPWLEPGESIILPATLKLLGQNAYETKLLYYNGTSHMKAIETCYSSNSSWDWVPCAAGGSDAWDFPNPMIAEVVQP